MSTRTHAPSPSTPAGEGPQPTAAERAPGKHFAPVERGQPPQAAARAATERSFGHDLSRLRVHEGVTAGAEARGAHARGLPSGSATIGAVCSASAASLPIQPLMAAGAFSGRLAPHEGDDHLAEIQRQLTKFHRLSAHLPGRHRQRLLLQLSDHAQTWLARPGNLRSPSRDAVLDLLDSTQDEYRSEIGRVLGGEAEFYGATDEAEQLFGQLAGGQGQLRIDSRDPAQPNVQFADFRRNTLAELGRLAQTPSGRKLLGKLNDGPRVTTVVPLSDTGAQRLGQLKQALGGVEEEPGSPALALADPRGTNDIGVLRERFAAANRNVTPITGVPRKNLQTFHGTPVGTDAVVALRPGLRDSDIFAHALDDQLLPTPTYLTLQHELNHAKRITRGRSRGRIASSLGLGYPNEEEARAITLSHSSENVERMARGLGTRQGHGGLLRAQLPRPMLQLPAPPQAHAQHPGPLPLLLNFLRTLLHPAIPRELPPFPALPAFRRQPLLALPAPPSSSSSSVQKDDDR